MGILYLLDFVYIRETILLFADVDDLEGYKGTKAQRQGEADRSVPKSREGQGAESCETKNRHLQTLTIWMFHSKVKHTEIEKILHFL